MTLYRKQFAGMTIDEAFACVMGLKTEEQAEALLEIEELRESDPGKKLMKTIAGPSGPSCQRLSEILAERAARAASTKAAKIQKKGAPQTRAFYPS
jgi:hypothetical protein